MGSEQNRVLAAIGAVSAILAAGGSSVFASQVKAKKDNAASVYTRRTHVSLQAVETLNRVQKGSHHVSVIYPGQTAPVASTHVQAMAPILRTVNRTSTPHTYAVKAGDNLWSIAEAKHTTVETLVDKNQLTSSIIHVGQKLTLSENNVPTEMTTTPAVAADALNVASANTNDADVAAATNQTDSGAQSSQSLAGSQADISSTAAVSNAAMSDSQAAQSVSSVATTITSQTPASADTESTGTTTAQSAETTAVQSTGVVDQNSAVSATASQDVKAASLNATQTVSQAASAATSAPVSAAPTPEQTNYNADQTVGTQVVQAAVNYESQQVPYVWGGASTNGMDCSGLVQQAYAQAGVTLPHNTVAQEAYFDAQDVNAAQPGDVLFWGQAGSTYHNAIAVGNNQYIAAPKPGSDVQTYTMDGQNFMPSFSGHLRR